MCIIVTVCSFFSSRDLMINTITFNMIPKDANTIGKLLLAGPYLPLFLIANEVLHSASTQKKAAHIAKSASYKFRRADIAYQSWGKRSY